MKIVALNPIVEKINVNDVCAACIGYFDGFHLGHRQLVKQTITIAKEKNIPSAVITFDPDPWVVLKDIDHVVHITTIAQRQSIANALGIDIWYQIQFTKELASFSPDMFIKEVIEPLRVLDLICGFDYTYGAYGKGKATDLLSYTSFSTHIIDSITYKNEKISSTRIEKLIMDGNMKETEIILGMPYTVQGDVIHGHEIGHKIGFPTVNLDICSVYVMPKNGVYAGYMNYNHKKYLAMINVGKNPTFHKEHQTLVEAHILDFDEMIYGKKIELEFKQFIREETTFPNADELSRQLKKDIFTIKDILK